MQGGRHASLPYVVLASLVLSFLFAMLALGMLANFQEAIARKDRELDTINEGFSIFKTRNDELTRSLERLSGMREIQMSSHFENFSDVLQNIFNVTHMTTEAKALTIYMESARATQTYAKAHMSWPESADVVIGEIYIFFEEEVLLEDEDKAIFELDQVDMNDWEEKGEINAMLYKDNRQVGLFRNRSLHGKDVPVDEALARLRHWVRGFSVKSQGVHDCWESHQPAALHQSNRILISVPILSQRIVVGVLCAEFLPEEHSEDGCKKMTAGLQQTLCDFGKSIGQPLKKEELYELATKDGLTGLFNKVHYQTQLGEIYHRMVRYKRPLSFIYIDIDHFKKVNDTHGHQNGDVVLKGVAHIVSESIRKTDIAFRYGGEELCVLLPETPLDEATGVAEKLRRGIQDFSFPLNAGGDISVTASFGVSTLNESMHKPEDLVEAADQALYRAKRSGRNRVIAAMVP